jgi:phage-related protein
MGWVVETLDRRVDRELDALPPGLRAEFIRIAELVEAHGPEALRAPYAKHLEGKLWEMRLKAVEGIARAIYVAWEGHRVVVLHAFVKKSQKTPTRALDVARKRLKEVV